MIFFLLPILLAVMVSGTAFVAILATYNRRPRDRKRDPVTVVVCARNEEDGIEECLLSLNNQTYPSELTELLLVDHLSTDRTGEIMERFAEDGLVNTRVIHIREDVGPLYGKVQALEIALQEVSTEYVLLTDGDCTVPVTWIDTLLSYFEDDIAVVNSHVNVEDPERGRTFIARMQHVLNRMFLALSVGYSALQVPKEDYHPLLRPFYGWLREVRPSFNMGNNQGLRMSAYREIGGFRHVGPSLIEDVALVNRILQRTRFRNAVVLDPRAVVTTRPSQNWREFWRQSRRWASATRNTRNNANTYLYTIVFLMRILLPWWALLGRRKNSLAAVVMVAGAEYALLENASRQLGERTPIRDVLLHLVVQFLFNHLLLLAVMVNWPVIWKGRAYQM